MHTPYAGTGRAMSPAWKRGGPPQVWGVLGRQVPTPPLLCVCFKQVLAQSAFGSKLIMLRALQNKTKLGLCCLRGGHSFRAAEVPWENMVHGYCWPCCREPQERDLIRFNDSDKTCSRNHSLGNSWTISSEIHDWKTWLQSRSRGK